VIARTPTALWWIGPDLVLALDERLGPPVDSYLNGSQTWLTPHGPGGTTLEWRLHPAAGYTKPTQLSHYDLWEQVVAQLSAGLDPDELVVGTARRPLSSLWEGLECFAAYGDELEPATLGLAVIDALGRAPDLTGLVDHVSIGDEWERSQGAASIVHLLAGQLSS
jgi:hypothetical protein